MTRNHYILYINTHISTIYGFDGADKKCLTKVPEFDIITPALSESCSAANLENDTEREREARRPSAKRPFGRPGGGAGG